MEKNTKAENDVEGVVGAFCIFGMIVIMMLI